MELTGGEASRMMGGDDKSRCSEEETATGRSVRVERWVSEVIGPLLPKIAPKKHGGRFRGGAMEDFATEAQGLKISSFV